jgi:outer membrane protein
MAGISASAVAQAPKFAHINSQELIMLMPESDSAKVKLDAFSKELQDQMESMQTEFQNKFAEYERRNASWTAGILEAKQKELQDLSRRIEEFRQVAGDEYQRQQHELMAPIFEKARNTISKVAKKEGYIYVFDTSGGALAYFDEQQSTDLLPALRKELNITRELPRSNR